MSGIGAGLNPFALRLRSEPDWTYSPPRTAIRVLRRRDKLVTVVNYLSAARRGYDVLDFNPTSVDPDAESTRGRFHSTNAEHYAYKYFAHLQRGDDERLAIWEVLTFSDLLLDPRDALFVPAGTIAPYAFVTVSPTRDIPVATLHNQADAALLLADIRALRGDNFKRTREWARYIRQKIRAVEGISFVSSAFGDSRGGGYAVVLFEPLPHATVSNKRQRRIRLRENVGMSTDKGRRRFQRAMRDVGLTVL